MENKEYTPGQNRPGRRGGMRGPVDLAWEEVLLRRHLILKEHGQI